MPFFDFHCHPGMKCRLAPKGQEPSPWQNITVQAQVLKIIKINISPMFADALDSQASLQQLWKGGVNLFGLVIHSIENKLALQLLEKPIIRNGHVLQLDPQKLERMGKGNDYFSITKEELKRLTDNNLPPQTMGLPAGTQLKFIKSMAEYDRNDLNTLHALLILEGSQNLFNDYSAPGFKEDFIKNLDELSGNFRIFAINPCHFQQQPIGNQAFAMQFLKNTPFFPLERGISEWGFEAIKAIYDRGIFVDTKHMGWYTRIELYRIRQEWGITLPLICTHAGVTGISNLERLGYFYDRPPLDEGENEQAVWRVRYLKKWGLVKDTAYNMSSLNLYDEDIEEILLSGGMIGVSLDQRIIGFPADEPLLYQEGIQPTDLDFISKKEANVFFGPVDPAHCPPREENNDEVMNFDDADSQNRGNTGDLHALYFLNQVLHIISVAKNSKRGLKIADAVRSICIGSDLDGLVNPLDCCMDTTAYPAFKDQLLKVMSKKAFWKGTGFSFGEINIAGLLDGIFFNNAEAFLLKYYV